MSRNHDPRTQAAARRALTPQVDAGLAVCWRCLEPIRPGQDWDAGHTHDLGLGGNPAGETRPEHARKADCPAGGNRSAGARLGAQLRPRGRRRLSAWLESGRVDVSLLLMLAAVALVTIAYLIEAGYIDLERREPNVPYRYVYAGQVF